MSPLSRSSPNRLPAKLCGRGLRDHHGCGDACPIYPGRRYMEGPVGDPIGQPMENVRHIRDDVAARLKALCHEIDVILA